MANYEEETANTKLAAFIEKNKKFFIAAIVIIICAVIGYIIAASVMNKATAKNLQALDEIVFELTDKSSDLEEAEVETRRQTAIEKASAYVKKGGITGARANMLCADLTYQQKNYSESAEYWKETAKKAKKSYLAPIAYFNLAACNEELGQTDEAAANYKLAADSKDFVMREHAMFSYARVMETKGDYTEASAVYTELNDKYSDSEWANLAKSRLIALKNDGKIQ